jgi:formylglycine-generating enzyme required for sulfatase activity
MVRKFVMSLLFLIIVFSTLGCQGILLEEDRNSSTDIPTLVSEPSPTQEMWTLEDNGHEMVLISAGEFQMGAAAEIGYELCLDYGRNCTLHGYEDEEPIHDVYLDEFLIDVYEVTNQQYIVFLQLAGNQSIQGKSWLDVSDNQVVLSLENDTDEWLIPEGYERHPVVEVTWDGAKSYCEWFGGALPTEAQWEKAAGGGTDNLFPWGDTFADENANIGNSGTTPVGSYPAGKSPYGLYDVSGNVAEWVYDRYSEHYFKDSPYENPTGPRDGSDRVLKGDSWGGTVDYLRPQARFGHPQSESQHDVGFRCVDNLN